MDAIITFYHKLNEWADPVGQQFFPCGSVWNGIGVLIPYLYFVKILGPKLMAKREPFKLERVMQVYNAIQVVLCAYLMYKALMLAWWDNYTLICQPVEQPDSPGKVEVVRVVWYFYLLKVLDLLDTVFFVLRKKYGQVTFLHLYHHGGMVFGSFMAVRYLPGGHSTFLGPVNLFVHVIMYSYYLAASLKMNVQWCKKYITQLQLIQFFILTCHFGSLLWKKDCAYPQWVGLAMVPQNLFMMILFGEFYYNTYVKKPSSKGTQINTSADIPNGKAKQQ